MNEPLCYFLQSVFVKWINFHFYEADCTYLYNRYPNPKVPKGHVVKSFPPTPSSNSPVPLYKLQADSCFVCRISANIHVHELLYLLLTQIIAACFFTFYFLMYLVDLSVSVPWELPCFFIDCVAFHCESKLWLFNQSSKVVSGPLLVQTVLPWISLCIHWQYLILRNCFQMVALRAPIR